MSIFLLKIVAVFFMVVDHIKYAFPFCVNQLTLYFGRIAFPLFCFAIVQGYIHTHDLKKYLTRLIIAGFVSEIPYLLFNSLPTIQLINLNIMWTLALGIIALMMYDYFKKGLTGIISVLAIGIVANISKVDYGFFGVLLIFSFYIFKDNKFKTLIASSLVVSGKYLFRFLILKFEFSDFLIKNWICTLIPLFIVLLYNGKKGPSLKWFFYIFYPIHFIILWLLSPYTFNLLNI